MASKKEKEKAEKDAKKATLTKSTVARASVTASTVALWEAARVRDILFIWIRIYQI